LGLVWNGDEEHHDGVAKRGFELSTTVPGAPSAVIDFLMELDKHFDLHPFLVSATIECSGSSHRGPWWDWRVVERSQIGPLRFRIRLRMRMVRTSPTSLESRVRALPGCYVRGITRCVASEDGQTILTERVDATAPLLLVGYLARQARAAHANTYARLPQALVP
jgi:hypothetical protein